MLTAPGVENMTLSITEEMLVRAPLETTFESVIAQLGRLNETHDGKRLPMVLEPAGGKMVSGSPRRQRSPLGARAGDQTTDVARTLRSALHVSPGDVERAIPPE
jgi:hypothetical protein